ncbi:MAG: hypothetical protein LLG00_13340 [Planctomycetaceae bacterium]|nr:hypothetical protein [Planctomycetaceae bacterium]
MSIQDPDGNTTGYVYDSLDRVRVRGTVALIDGESSARP